MATYPNNSNGNSQGVISQVVSTGADAVVRATKAANRAVSSLDFDGLGATLANAAQHAIDQVRGYSQAPVRSPYVITPKRTGLVGGLQVAGGVVLLATAVSSLVFSLIFTQINGVLAAMGFLSTAAFVAGGVALVSRGTDTFGLGAYIDRIAYALADRLVVPVRELSVATGIPMLRLRKILKRALSCGSIPQGRLEGDGVNETLYLTNASYNAHLQSQANIQKAQAYEQARRQADSQMPGDAQRVVSACQRFAMSMMRASERITHEDTRRRMANLTDRIARMSEAVRSHPDVAPKLDRYVEYYLPTTEKLVNAYAELDAVQATGANADATRQEVDEMLDLLTSATDKQLDDLRLDQVWDVSGDAYVMRTMLSQDGLTGQR